MKDRKLIKRTSMKQEVRVADTVDGRTEANSGAATHAGADVRKMCDQRIECKFTWAKEYKLKLSDLDKVRLQAINGGLETPVMQIDFTDKRTGRSKKFAVISWADYLYLMGEQDAD